MRAKWLSFYAVIAGASLVAAGCFEGSSSGPGDAQRTIERYVEAIDERDGEEVCSLFSDDVRERYDSAAEEAAYQEDLDCAKIVSGFIDYVEDSGIPEWKHVRLEGEPRVAVDGDEARASFYVTHQIEDYDAVVNR